MKNNFPKAMTLYRIKDGFKFDLNSLGTSLKKFSFKPLLADEMSRLGFSPIFENMDEPEYFFQANNGFFIQVTEQQKVIPADELNQRFKAKLAFMELAGQTHFSKHEKTEIKFSALQDMLPQAFSHLKTHRMLLLPPLNLLVVFSSSNKLCENVTALLRKALSSLPIAPINAASNDKNKVFTDYLTEVCKGEITINNLSLGCDIDIQHYHEKAKFKGIDIIDSEQAQEWINDAGTIQKLALINSSCEFTITENMCFSSIKWSDAITLQSSKRLDEQGENDLSGDEQKRLLIDSDLYICRHEVVKLIEQVFSDDGFCSLAKYTDDDKAVING